MSRLKRPLLFALALFPISAVAAYFTVLYQLDNMDEVTIHLTTSQLGSLELLIAVSVAQTAVYAFVCAFVGYILASKLGLMKPIRFEKRPLGVVLLLSALCGILFSLDYWTFGCWIPGVQESAAATLNWKVVLASVLYGGVVEELMLRLFVMSLLAWLIWKVFFRKREVPPSGVVIAANGIAAVLFAAGHLPATQVLFGTLTPLILVRCFLLNGGFGVLFGWLYRKFGIQYAMLSHALLHVISKLIWFVFI